jgi:transmembrane sensor
MKPRLSDTDRAIAEEAARWVIELEESRPGDLATFAEWLEASPRHVEEFLLASAIWKELDGIDADKRIQVDQLIALATQNVRRLDPPATTELPAPARPTKWSLAVAGLAVTLVVALLLFVPSVSQIYATARGEQRAFKLEDGSIVSLNTQSRVEVSYSPQARTLRLVDGEALFTVEHDPVRPFRVITQDTVIQAVGTQFNVYRSKAGTTVAVVEGIVQISTRSETDSADMRLIAGTQAITEPARVAAGEQVRLLPRGEVVKEVVADLTHVTAWRERRLVFRGESLATIAEEFNRYNRIQIHVEGQAARDKRLTAVFAADDPHSLLQFLQGDAVLDVRAGGQEVWIRAR